VPGVQPSALQLYVLFDVRKVSYSVGNVLFVVRKVSYAVGNVLFVVRKVSYAVGNVLFVVRKVSYSVELYGIFVTAMLKFTAMNIFRKLPIGIQDFEDLCMNNYLYVDKTACISQLTINH
jgi:hypothetical protein